ncbi:MAG: PAS domain S-box protein, partial [Desulfobacteraceae bacterium]|nr:PAS domain S-box protein [Desulfobacteraceae bacterium]
TLEEAIKLILTSIFKLEEFDSGGIYLVNEESKGLELKSHIGLPPEFVEKVKYFPADDVRTKMVMKGNLIYMMASETPKPIEIDLKTDGILGLTIVPIKFGDNIIGSINLASHSHAVISDLSKDILESVAEISVGATIYRVSSENALRKSEEKFRRIFDNLQDGYMWGDSDGNILLANKFATNLLGYDLKELMQKNFAQDIYFFPEERETVKEIMYQTGKIENYELAFKRKDGQKIIVEANSHLVYNDDQERSMEGTFRDITSRKQAEEDQANLEKQLRQAHKMESIGILAGGIAHDFNNVLSIIIGNVELALSDMQDWSPAYKNIQEIKTASFRAKDVVKQLLSFSRKSDQDWEILDIVPILKESLTLVRSSIPSNI